MSEDYKPDLQKLMKINHVSVDDLAKNIPKTNFTFTGLNESLKKTDEMFKHISKSTQEAHIKKEQYEQDILNTLRQIEGNTANLTTLVNLIQTSNDNQGEILELISELLALAKEKDPEVVDSKYRKIMNKITTFTEDVNTMTTLISFGTMIINILKSGA